MSFFLLLFYFCQSKTGVYKPRPVKVKIENFNVMGAHCGVMNYVTVYKASVVKPNFSIPYNEFLLYVHCRESFGIIASENNIYNIVVDDEMINMKNVPCINLTNVDSASSQKLGSYKLISVTNTLKK